VFARLEEWSEGFVDRFPGGGWKHAAFAPNVAAIIASLLLDLAWHWLTPAGRSLIREALRTKGIPFIEPFVEMSCYTMRMNQGARFLKGIILAHMAAAERLDDPALRATLGEYHKRLNACVEAQTRDDGTFNEGTGYGAHTLESTLLSYHAIARCLGRPVVEIVPDRLLRCLRFTLDAERTIAPGLAAFAAGPLGLAEFADQCEPQGFAAAWNPETHYFGVDALWSPATAARPRVAKVAPFSAYPRGGWVFMGDADPSKPRLSLESGFWADEGHAWKTKNALTLDSAGQTLLLTRQYANYNDSRFAATARTAAYNTFAPGGRSQSEDPRGNRGAELRVARDLGPIAVAESDAASAWTQGVRLALRRVVLLRPWIMLVDDTAELDEEETGVQSWNTLGSWGRTGKRSYRVAVGGVEAELHSLLPSDVEMADAEDSVHEGKRPVFRLAITSPKARTHRIATLVAVSAGDLKCGAPRINFYYSAGNMVKVVQGELLLKIVLTPAKASEKELRGCRTDGALFVSVLKRGKFDCACAFGATYLQTPKGRTEGAGFLSV
ncbi:MAG: hypothetical protein NTW19_03350, partial [Planctomycetota bacterium]|nr:hypothetical protein [Planctomycetota bacterium]